MECGGPRVSEQQSKDSAQEGSCQVQKTNLKHASTPGGVRRIVVRLRDDRRTPLHSLALADVQRISQNLGGSCQNLERILAISAAILAAKWNCIC